MNWHCLEAHTGHVQGRDDGDGIPTDTDDDNPTPKKRRAGLVRSYAIGLIPDTDLAVKSNNDDYDPVTEQEKASETEDENEEDEDKTPKKKKNKPKVRDLIEAQREDLAIPKAQQEDTEVSATSSELRVPHIYCLIRFAKST
jgi:hypothetical protein